MAQSGFTPIVSKRLAPLADRDRLVLVRDLLASYGDRLLDYRGVVRAEVTTAVALDPARADAIKKGLGNLTGRTLPLVTKIDPAIIGGLTVKLGSRMVDSSLRTKLNSIKFAMKEAR